MSYPRQPRTALDAMIPAGRADVFDRLFRAVFLAVAILGIAIWLAIFKENYHPRIHRYNEEATMPLLGRERGRLRPCRRSGHHLVPERGREYEDLAEVIAELSRKLTETRELSCRLWRPTLPSQAEMTGRSHLRASDFPNSDH